MRIPALAACALLCGAAASAQPTIDKIQNNYGWQLPGTPNYGIAQGSIFAIIGKNLGPSPLAQAAGYPLDTTLSGVSVSVAVGGQTVSVPLYYVWTNAIAGVLPSNTPVGDGTLTVKNGTATGTAPIRVVARAFGLLALNGGGSGTVTAQNFSADQSGKMLVGYNQSARPNESLIFYGTGLGASTNDTKLNNTVQNWATTIPVTVWFGSTSVTPEYAGRSAYYPGLDQINVKIPAGLQGCNVSVYLQIGSGSSTTVSNFTTLPVANGNGRTCSDANGLQAADIDMMTKGGRFGTIALDHSDYDFSMFGFSVKNVDESADGNFYRIDPVNLGGIVANNPFKYASVGSCTVWSISTVDIQNLPDIGGKELDAGNALTINKGPGSDTKTIARVEGSKGYYHVTLSSGSGPTATTWLSPGAYTITGPGGTGADPVGSFTMNLTMPPALVWDNRDAIANVTRSSGVTVTWHGADPNSEVLISGMSLGGKQGDPMVFFVCTAPASAKTFTVPPGVLLSLPASGDLPGFLILGTYTNTKMSSPPTGLDALYGTTASSSGKTVTYQ